MVKGKHKNRKKIKEAESFALILLKNIHANSSASSI